MKDHVPVFKLYNSETSLVSSYIWGCKCVAYDNTYIFYVYSVLLFWLTISM